MLIRYQRSTVASLFLSMKVSEFDFLFHSIRLTMDFGVRKKENTRNSFSFSYMEQKNRRPAKFEFEYIFSTELYSLVVQSDANSSSDRQSSK